VRKAFGATLALSGIDLEARAGEVHAVLGENGAGKSTLMKVLSGALRPDAGRIHVDDNPYAPDSALEARRAGVQMVYQESSLCPDLTVAENVVLGAEPSRFGIIDGRTVLEQSALALELVVGKNREGAPQPGDRVRDLSASARQLVEIARALAQTDCRILILDEPTSSLGAADVDRLFDVLRSLRDRGLTILYISHFLEEVQRIADRYTVLRDGRTVAAGPIAETTLSELVRAMVGRPVERLFARSPRAAGEVILEVDRLAGAKRPIDASLSLRRREVLGIAGLVGAGRTELLRAIFGLDRVRDGSVRVGAWVGSASPTRRLEQSVGLLSEDRKTEGLALSLSVTDNLTLSKPLPPRSWRVSPRLGAEAARFWVEALKVRCRGPEQRCGELSGGNQQKVAFARLLHHDVDVLLLDEPTRGVDIGSKAELYRVIDELATKGKAVLLVSSSLPELLGVSDRIAVMRRGVLGPARPAEELDEHALLMEATGA
jgi:ribose transport system ATP-binding protein